MRRYKDFKASLSEEQRKQFERYTLEWYIYGCVAGVMAVFILAYMGVI